MAEMLTGLAGAARSPGLFPYPWVLHALERLPLDTGADGAVSSAGLQLACPPRKAKAAYTRHVHVQGCLWPSQSNASGTVCVQLELSTTKRGRGSSEHMEANDSRRVMPRPRAPGSLSLSHTLS